ncbi:MAG: hypothetical protein GY874_03975 [Desulfobacteraceae bacterium]|nr:hypothetical protein [Desulfobacteraceae bacterium]
MIDKRESFLMSLRSAVIWKSFDRIVGLLKHIIIAAAIGLSVQLDIFYMAMALMGLFVFTWAQMLEVMAVPKLVELIGKEKISEFKSLSGGIFVLSLLFATILALILFFGREHLSKIALGFDPERKYLLAESIIWFFPVLILYIPFHFIGSVFRAMRRFSIFYQAEFIAGASALVLIITFKEHPRVLLWSFSVGFAGAFLYLFYFFCMKLKPWGNPFSKAVVNVLRVAPGLLMLQCAHYIYILTDRIFITFLASGSIGALAYGRTLAFMVEAVVNVKGSFVTIFSEAKDNHKKNETFNNLVSFVIYLSLPLTIFFLFFGEKIISILLKRGLFTSADTQLVYLALSGFSWSIMPMMMQMPMEQIYQIHGRIDLMVKRKFSGILINLILNYTFIFILKIGVLGIALATSISYWCVLAYGIIATKKIGLAFKLKRHFLWSLWVAASASIASLILYYIGALFESPFTIICQFVCFCLFIIAVGVLYCGEEGTLIKNVIKRMLSTCSS